MANQTYKLQVKLLLSILPIIKDYPQLALKGGTAINLFVQQDMPRLSVDIDLVYLNIEDRQTTFNNVDVLINEIAVKIKQSGRNVRITNDKGISKIYIRDNRIEIKLEINPVTRGGIYDCIELPLGNVVVEEFQYGYTTKIVSLQDLYAGKICAALSRKHPRDLFDVKLMLERNIAEFNESFMNAVVIYISCSNKSFYDLLDAKLPAEQEFSDTFINKFEGMTNLLVTPDELIDAYTALLRKIHDALTDNQKNFILSLANGEPDWSLINLSRINELPGITWKLKNILIYKDSKPEKHAEDIRKLKEEILKVI